MAKESIEDTLAHIGIKGMKWGMRKARKSSGPDSKDYTEVKALRKRKPSTLSNAELRQLTTRMQLEQQYNQLNPNKLQKGKKKLDLLIGVANTVNSVISLADSSAGKFVLGQIK